MPPTDNAAPLPPSVEAAYYRKCIALKRRLNDIEANNEQSRLRMLRLGRAILKMRLERAFLLERLEERMAPNPVDSERSSSPPPTPLEKPTRSKRVHREKTPPVEGHQDSNAGAQQPYLHPLQAVSSAQSTPDPARATDCVGYGDAATAAASLSSAPPSGSAQESAAAMPRLLPMLQAQLGGDRLNNGMDDRGVAAENGASIGSGDYGRPFTTASASNPQADTCDVRMEANDAGVAERAAPSRSGGFGFTAVNR